MKIVPIAEWPGYSVSDTGVVFGPLKRALKNIYFDSDGRGIRYYRVTLCAGSKKRKSFLVHTLVMSAFGQLRPSVDHDIDHIDGNGLNNSIPNLEWVTKSENVQRSIAMHGGKSKLRKSHLPCSICNEAPRWPGSTSYCYECKCAKMRHWHHVNKDRVSKSCDFCPA